MIEVLLGSKNAERVLLYILVREAGYAREIASFYGTDLKPIQMQLDKFEKGSILVSIRTAQAMMEMRRGNGARQQSRIGGFAEGKQKGAGVRSAR